MKTILSLIITLLALPIEAQFSAPKDLKYSSIYIELGQSDYCNGNALQGPTYCASFKWSKPDTTNSEGKLESYNIYYKEMYSSDTVIVANVSDTIYISEWGVMGQVWVTALYSNPNGESSPSNIINNEELPINIDILTTKNREAIFYNREQEKIELQETNFPYIINLYDINGTLLQSEKNVTVMDISNTTTGIYIVELIDRNSNLTRKKIIK